MRHGYVLGPLVLLPLLGAFFLVPQPDEDQAESFTRAPLSLLECHAGAGEFVALTGGDSASSRIPGSAAPTSEVLH